MTHRKRIIAILATSAAAAVIILLIFSLVKETKENKNYKDYISIHAAYAFWKFNDSVIKTDQTVHAVVGKRSASVSELEELYKQYYVQNNALVDLEEIFNVQQNVSTFNSSIYSIPAAFANYVLPANISLGSDKNKIIRLSSEQIDGFSVMLKVDDLWVGILKKDEPGSSDVTKRSIEPYVTIPLKGPREQVDYTYWESTVRDLEKNGLTDSLKDDLSASFKGF